MQIVFREGTGEFWVALEQTLQIDLLSEGVGLWQKRHGIVRTVEDLINLTQFIHPNESRRELLARITAHCESVLRVRADTVNERTRFINDLGLD